MVGVWVCVFVHGGGVVWMKDKTITTIYWDILGDAYLSILIYLCPSTSSHSLGIHAGTSIFAGRVSISILRPCFSPFLMYLARKTLVILIPRPFQMSKPPQSLTNLHRPFYPHAPYLLRQVPQLPPSFP